MRPTASRGRCASSVRFNITGRGTKRIREHLDRREYERQLREMPHYEADLAVKQDEDGDWVIVAQLEPSLTHGRFGLDERQLGQTFCWDTEEEARDHLAEHEDELRMELVEDLFTMGLCTRCEAVVPVFGDYVPYGPAGSLVCGPCLSGDEDDPDGAGPAIIRT